MFRTKDAPPKPDFELKDMFFKRKPDSFMSDEDKRRKEEEKLPLEERKKLAAARAKRGWLMALPGAAKKLKAKIFGESS